MMDDRREVFGKGALSLLSGATIPRILFRFIGVKTTLGVSRDV